MYDPTLGRFLSEDPLGFLAGDPNLRRYVGNHPTYAVDPTGLAEEDAKLVMVPVFIHDLTGEKRTTEDLQGFVDGVNRIFNPYGVGITLAGSEIIPSDAAAKLLNNKDGKLIDDLAKHKKNEDGTVTPDPSVVRILDGTAGSDRTDVVHVFIVKQIIVKRPKDFDAEPYGWTYRHSQFGGKDGCFVRTLKPFDFLRTVAHELYHYIADDNVHPVDTDNLVSQPKRVDGKWVYGKMLSPEQVEKLKNAPGMPRK